VLLFFLVFYHLFKPILSLMLDLKMEPLQVGKKEASLEA
jgi:hypothetical protein